jgi:hypothetical protein
MSTTRVAIVRDRFVSASELDNYRDIDDAEVIVIGSKGTAYDGPFGYETLSSPSSVPHPARHPAQVLAGRKWGSSTYMKGLVETLGEYDIVHTV